MATAVHNLEKTDAHDDLSNSPATALFGIPLPESKKMCTAELENLSAGRPANSYGRHASDLDIVT
jgi:hypothetical protein